MDTDQELLHSIIAGYVSFKGLRLYKPNYSIEYEASRLYNETYSEALESSYTSETILEVLYNNGLWDISKEERFQTIPKSIEDAKLNLYENRLKSETKKSIKATLSTLRSEYSSLFSQRHAYDSYTCEGISNFTRLAFIARSCTFFKEKLYKFNRETLESVIYEYQKSTLDESVLRRLARTESWQQYWTSLKSGIQIFKEPNEEQRKLIRISTFYDNLHSSMECPPDWVIEDDDLLDGYLIFSRKEREKEENQNDLEKTLSPKIANSSEVYIVCENEEDAKKVYDLNSNYVKNIQIARNKVIAEKGRVNDIELPDMKQRMQMEIAKVNHE